MQLFRVNKKCQRKIFCHDDFLIRPFSINQFLDDIYKIQVYFKNIPSRSGTKYPQTTL